MAQEEKVIVVHEKSRGETVRVYLGEYKGITYLHIREWYTDKDQEQKPTKKGIALPLDKIPGLREALNELVPQD